MKLFSVILPILFLILVEVYAYFAIKTITQNKYIIGGYIIGSIIIFLLFNFVGYNISRHSPIGKLHFFVGIFVLIYIPKLIIASGLLIEDLIRVISYVSQWIIGFSNNSQPHFPDRRKFVSMSLLGISGFVFFNVLYGIVKGRFQFRVINKDIEFDDLPDAFDGYKILQISDIHIGSFSTSYKEDINKAIDLMLEQKADIILFTGDMVNNLASEMLPFESIFSRLHAPDGMYSTLGNHDYGIYYYNHDYPNYKEKRQENIQQLLSIHERIGFNPLNNQHIKIQRLGEHINIAGVENWGNSRHFPKKAKLAEAMNGIEENEFTVLMSHDPSFFDFQKEDAEYQNIEDQEKDQEVPIISFPKKIQLTLSGHTHGMQFGVEIPGLIKWSPVQYRYKKWAGLYEQNGRYIYVNRGFGFLGFPGRVGILPEISVITLRKK